MWPCLCDGIVLHVIKHEITLDRFFFMVFVEYDANVLERMVR